MISFGIGFLLLVNLLYEFLSPNDPVKVCVVMCAPLFSQKAVEKASAMIIVWLLLKSKVSHIVAKLSEFLGMAFKKLFESCLLLEIPDLARLLILALT